MHTATERPRLAAIAATQRQQHATRAVARVEGMAAARLAADEGKAQRIRRETAVPIVGALRRSREAVVAQRAADDSDAKAERNIHILCLSQSACAMCVAAINSCSFGATCAADVIPLCRLMDL